jgi:hypothetical protein
LLCPYFNPLTAPLPFYVLFRRRYFLYDKKNTPNLLIDIQAKLREGKGAGYEQWAKVFNIKQMAKTLLWLQENKIDSYEDLCRRASAASGEFHRRNVSVK